MRHLRFGASALVLGLLVATSGVTVAQSPGPADSSAPAASPLVVPVPAADPVAAVNAFLDALVAKQWDKLPSLACASQQESVASSFGVTSPEIKALLDAMQVSLADRNVSLTNTSGDTATVAIAGKLSIQISDDALRTYVGTMFSTAGQSPAPSDVDQFVAQMQAAFGALSLASVVTVANESGGWLVCSEILGSGSAATPAPSPAS